MLEVYVVQTFILAGIGGRGGVAWMLQGVLLMLCCVSGTPRRQYGKEIEETRPQMLHTSLKM